MCSPWVRPAVCVELQEPAEADDLLRRAEAIEFVGVPQDGDAATIPNVVVEWW